MGLRLLRHAKKEREKKQVWFVFVTSLLNFWSSLCYLSIIYPLLYHLYRHLLSLLLFDTLIIFLIIYLHYYISSLSLLINFIAILYAYHPDHPSLFFQFSFIPLSVYSFIHSLTLILSFTNLLYIFGNLSIIFILLLRFYNFFHWFTLPLTSFAYILWTKTNKQTKSYLLLISVVC